MYEQKEIVLVPFPYTDLTSAKLRPALIISNNKINTTQDRICCLITSNISTDGILIKKEDFKEGKLPFRSWVKPHRIFTIHERIIRKKLGITTNEFHDKILAQLYRYLEKE